MNHVSSRTRSQIDLDSDQITTITLRSSIRGLEGLIISIPPHVDDDSSDITYIETETDASEEDVSEHSQQHTGLNLDKLNKYKFVVSKSDIPGDDCPICLDGFKCRQHCRRFDCSHVFHKKCIDRWLLKNVHCPGCRICVQPLKPVTRSIRILRSRRVLPLE